jgi:RHS repeat-associated protein
MKIQNCLLFVVGLLSSLKLFSQSQDFIYINSNNKEQTGTPQKSFQYVREVILKPGFIVTGSSTTWYARPVDDIGNSPQSFDKNFVRIETMLVPVTIENAISALPVASKSTQYEYTDDLGRGVQQVSVKASPLQNDIVTAAEYDLYGRQPKEFLPFAIANRNGSYRANAVVSQTGDVFKFYAGTPKVAQDITPFKLSEFDDSPLNQVRSSYGPGASWHDNFKSITNSTSVEVNSTILKWKYISDLVPPTVSFYPPKTLVYSDTKDEEGVVTRAYKNFRDQNILTIRDATGGSYKTYNIFDISGKLCLVIPPEAAERIATEYTAGGITDAQRMDFLNRWAFQYVYDEYGRMIKKRAPGASDWTLMVYDKWDRLVLTREPGWTANQWTFTKYDVFNRPIITGIYSTTFTHDVLRTNAMNSNVRHEEPVLNNATGYHFTNTFPTTVTEADLLTVTYYDNYNFIYTGWDAENFNYSYSSSSKQDPVKGYTTGSKVRVLGVTPSRWINTVTYYDKKYRTLHTIGENYQGGIDRITNTYDFPGRLVSSTHLHTSSSENITVLKEFAYDHAGRLLTEHQTIGGGLRTLLVSNQYNELGQVVEKNLHSVAGSPFLQSVDYRYNIRGWTTHINNSTLSADANNDDTNDIFGMDLLFNQSETINGVATTPLYNGNISAIRWKTNNLKDSPKEKVFGFTYDKLSRLSSNRYAEKSGGTWSGALDMFKESMTYDRNGNIKTLNRWMNYNGTSTQVDALIYKYGNNPAADNWGNKLYNVHDGTIYYNKADKNPAYGYSETMHDPLLQEYTYDNSGRMLTDQNKEITGITYNYLNMPQLIQLSGNRQIEYTYDAAGNKLRIVAKENGVPNHQTDYVGSFNYVNGSLTFINHSEGRAVRNNTGGYNYEYFIQDHQNNTRAVFGALKETKEYRATMEPVLASQEEITTDPVNGFRNLPTGRTGSFNRTKRSALLINPNFSAETNGNLGSKAVGPAKMLQVTAGDRIQLEVFARYQTATNSAALAPGFISTVTGAFGLVPGEVAHSALTTSVPGYIATIPTNSLVAKAYLCYMLFDNSYVPRQFGFAPISNLAAVQHQRLFIDATLTHSGFVYVFVANESNVSAATSVFFDDLQIVHEKNNSILQVTQTSDYLPFGLSFNEYFQNRAGNTNVPYSQNKYRFQDQELQTGNDLDWYHFKYRMHDPAIGRFHLVDPLADKYTYNSTYAFSENRLVDGVELEGKEFFKKGTPLSVHVGSAPYIPHGGNVLYGFGTYSLDFLSYSFLDMGLGNLSYQRNKNDYKHSKGVYSDEVGLGSMGKHANNLISTSNSITQGVGGFNNVMGVSTTIASLYFSGATSLIGRSMPTLRGISYSRNMFSNGVQKMLFNPNSFNRIDMAWDATRETVNQISTVGVADIDVADITTSSLLGFNTWSSTMLSNINYQPFSGGDNLGWSHSYGTKAGNWDIATGTISGVSTYQIQNRVKNPTFNFAVGTYLDFLGKKISSVNNP